MAASTNGTSWSARDDAKAFAASGKDELTTSAVAAGPGGYVVVGAADDDAATWSSSDAKDWDRSSGAALEAPKDGGLRMSDVTSGPFGYVAVGSASDDDDVARPAAWVSDDGGSWSRVELPLPRGARSATLSHVAVNGKRLVAAGVAQAAGGDSVFAMTSTDGGKSWQPTAIPGGPEQRVRVGDVVPSGRGFALLGSGGRTRTRNVRLWTSADGTAWKAREVTGNALAGKGVQAMNAAVVTKDRLLGVGSTSGANDEHVTIWHTELN